MIKIEISGDTPAAFYTEAMNALMILAQGGNKVFTPQAPPNQPVDPPPAETVPVTALENPSVAPVAPKKRPGRPPKAAQTLELTAEPITVKVDEDPLGLSVPPEQPKKDITLDDCKQRVKDIITAHQERGNAMPVCIGYVRKLFEPFNIKLAAELKPDQFADFMAKSQAYLDGKA